METRIPPEASEFLEQWLGRGWSAEMIAGDVSARGYFRICSPAGEHYMLAYYPDSLRGDVGRFLDAYKAIASHAPVPAVVRHSGAAIAQHDLGDKTLFDLLHRDRELAVTFYRTAVDMLVEFQRSPDEARHINPQFDAAKFRDELEMTNRYYVVELMGCGDRAAELISEYEKLAATLAQHPYVLCHRDYHGQNIHIQNDALYMIDYQDLRMGPDTYDIASLLRDRGVADLLGESTERDLLAYYRERTGADDDIERRYYESLLQRSIKTIGTFAKQAVAHGRTSYLRFIPPALGSIRACLAQLPEYETLGRLFPMSFDPAWAVVPSGGDAETTDS